MEPRDLYRRVNNEKDNLLVSLRKPKQKEYER